MALCIRASCIIKNSERTAQNFPFFLARLERCWGFQMKIFSHLSPQHNYISRGWFRLTDSCVAFVQRATETERAREKRWIAFFGHIVTMLHSSVAFRCKMRSWTWISTTTTTKKNEVDEQVVFPSLLLLSRRFSFAPSIKLESSAFILILFLSRIFLQRSSASHKVNQSIN